ncbi:MAG: hypothetical protein LW807_04290 [Proteobacteria bacterium]|jgi:hypothetical protein|nr:hypothetical protein [Pseudomonadota bacterium]
MTTISSILNPDYLVEATQFGRLHHNGPLRYCFQLQEDDPLTKNKQINIITTQQHKVTVFKSDYRNHTHRQINPLHIFNNSVRGLTKIPDYILFYELPNIIYAIVIELKSHHFSGVQDKFKNGDRVAQFINNVYNQGKELRILHLLFRLPERTIKKPVYLRNDRSITKQSFGYACTLDTIHFNHLINIMELG